MKRREEAKEDKVHEKLFSASSEYRDELVRLTREKADKISLENELKRGKLVYKTDVEKVWTDTVMTVRAQLLNIPKKLSLRLAKTQSEEEVEKILRESVDAILFELAGSRKER